MEKPERRRKLRDAVDGSVKALESSQDARLLDENFHQAYTLMSSAKAREAFDINKETDWRIASSPPTLAAYKAMALDPYFNP